MIPAIVVLIYLLILIVIGCFAFKQGKANTEDFFLASRTIGPMVFFLSIFATNMTAFAIIGSSGLAYRAGIGVYGLMASSSGFVIPLTIFLIGTRLWSLGKRFGHMTQVQFFRDRWECSGIGTLIFALSVAMLVPYMIISIIGGGRVLNEISVDHDETGKVVMQDVLEHGIPVMEPVMKAGKPVASADGKPMMSQKREPKTLVPYWLGCAFVAIAVTLIVFLGGMRSTVWVNIFQTVLFLSFGLVAVLVISNKLPGGFAKYISNMAADENKRGLVTRLKMSPWYFWSYTFIPLSSIMFPHMSIMCLSAKKVSAFKRTVILYPLAIMAIWLPCVFLGVIGSQTIPGLKQTDGILLQMLGEYAPVWLSGILGAGIISAVMGSDCHQVLALSTMFTKDVFSYYGGTKKYGEKGTVFFARVFIILLTVVAYIIALMTTTNIFELAIRFAFSGFAAMAPIMLAALFWKRSTKWGALSSTLFVGASLIGFALLQQAFVPGGVWGELWKDAAGKSVYLFSMPQIPNWKIGMPKGDISVLWGFMPVVPMVFGSALCMFLGSISTPPPSKATIQKYFGAIPAQAEAPQVLDRVVA